MYLIFKRVCDFTVAVLMLPLFAVVYILVGLAIKLDDGGPVMYNSLRLGQHGRLFKMYKFRSMRVNAPDIRNADGTTFNSAQDSRLTKIGGFIRKTSLDEIPQVLNVLLGDMSFIGPRPDLPEALYAYTPVQRTKLYVRPGITGYNQAYFRNNIDVAHKFMNDVYYVQHISLRFDLQILLRTIYVVLGCKNIYNA